MKIFAQYIDNKFINSLSDINNENISAAAGYVHNNLYDIHYKYNFDTYIFLANGLTAEIYQFVQDYADSTHIVFYHNNSVNENILNLSTKIKHISHASHDLCLTIPLLVNDHIFSNSNNETKSENILCFLDGHNSIPNQLKSILYPNTKNRLQLFSKTIKHQQNFGYLSELEKAQLLNNSKYYLDIDNNYLVEAMLCGAKVMVIDDQNKISTFSGDAPEYMTYCKFIESI